MNVARPSVDPASSSPGASGAVEAQGFGFVDDVQGNAIAGWAVDLNELGTPQEVEFIVGGTVVARAIARGERADIEAAGLGTKIAGFLMFVDTGGCPGTEVEGIVRLSRTGSPLANNPVRVRLPGHPAHQTGVEASIRVEVVKRLAWVIGEHAIVVADAPNGALRPHIHGLIASLGRQAVQVMLVVNTGAPTLLDRDLIEIAAGIIIRDSQGGDVAGWTHALAIEPRLYRSDRLYLISDKVVGPKSDEALQDLICRTRASEAALVGLTAELATSWHLQGYFLAIQKCLLASFCFQNVIKDFEGENGVKQVGPSFEEVLAAQVSAAGYKTEALFGIGDVADPAMTGWRVLLGTGFPFVSASVLRDAESSAGGAELRAVLLKAGFGPLMLDAALHWNGHRTARVAPATRPLLAGPVRPLPPLRPEQWQIAWYGPWNFDSGLSIASRAMISALRRIGCRLNLHPVKQPFHVHRMLVPATDVVEFQGPADIAVVHLNPDSWHLLTLEQQAAIANASKRIGYWVWEMDQLPITWRGHLDLVDRIWAPSQYCASIFEQQSSVPVDVVPHPVPVGPGMVDHDNRDHVLRSLDVDPERRIILYIFDGASFLIRKNPAALVRAFAASDLVRRGWSLVLKTKNLYDQRAAGDDLTSLVSQTEGVTVINRALSTGELRKLLAACDIYASPHSSEGFGLTIAEAMALSKPVIATDFGGSRDFLDVGCGYPVPGRRLALDDDHGPYQRGGSWVSIDEPALAAALKKAAEHVERGDRAIGVAARDRITTELSSAKVSELIVASFEATISGETPSKTRPLPRLETRALAALDPARLALPTGIAVLLISRDAQAVRSAGLETVSDSRDAWLIIAPDDVQIYPGIGGLIRRHGALRPDVSIFYGDEFVPAAAELSEQLLLKPGFDLTLFAASDYIGQVLAIRGEALHSLAGVDLTKGALAATDLVLRALEQGRVVDRITEVLVVHSERRPETPPDKRRSLLASSSLFAGYELGPGRAANTSRLKRRLSADRPAVTLCVPTARRERSDGKGLLIERLLDSLEMIDWPSDRLTVLVGDDVEGTPDWIDQKRPFAVEHINTSRPDGLPFNYSIKMNGLWRAAPSNVVVFVNDDVAALDGEWLGAMVGFATDPGVGAVGARLLYDDGRVQHAGVVAGLFGTTAHAWLGERADHPTYLSWATTQREWSVVTGAVLATRKDVLEQVNGYDERLGMEYNDMDLCLKLRSEGLRIVYEPHAELIHSEKQTRRSAPPPGDEVAFFRRKWRSWLDDDPAFHPGLRRDSFDLAPAIPVDFWYR